MSTLPTRLQGGNVWVNCTITQDDDKLALKTPYNKSLLAEIKAFDGARWNPDRRLWTIKDNERNRFQLAYLAGQNPYAAYDKPLVEHTSNRSLFDHQMHMVRHCLTYHHVILAAEMGCLHPNTLLKCEASGAVRTIEDWGMSGNFPTLRCYDRKGNIVVQRPSRFVTKSMKMLEIVLLNGRRVIVGGNHMFLSRNRLVLANKLRVGDFLTIEKDSLSYLTREQWKNAHYDRYARENDQPDWNIISTTVMSDVMSDHKYHPTAEAEHFVPTSFANLKSVEIVSIQEAGCGIVWDLTIPGYANYFDANGISHQNTGKTLAAIEVMEASGNDNWIYVGPKSALAAASLEYTKWKSKVKPLFYTYDGLKKVIANWRSGQPAPFGVIFDETSRIKTPTAQRTVAAYHLASSVRREHGEQGFVILMSGSPAPKSPADWFSQCEVAKPGFIREGTYEKFKQRLGLIIQKENLVTGGTYPQLVTWLDDDRKCLSCGKLESDSVHNLAEAVFNAGIDDCHPFVKSKNEVSYLYERMKGLVLVKFKKDCLDLPDKQYRVITCKPSQVVMNAARLITKAASTTIQALTLLRELSDGFQYEDTKVGTEPCPNCHGDGNIVRPILKEGKDVDGPVNAEDYEDQEISCPNCGGSGEVNKYQRETKMVPCPKEDALVDILDAHDEDGRLVVYGGFTGSVDRILKIISAAGWNYIRVDGRGWVSSMEGQKRPEDMLLSFQDKSRVIPKLAFVGQPSAAGMGLTLTESCEIVYYSNDFNAESRIQSEDRIHRTGMDVNKGALITDLVHLPSDSLIMENLKKKRKLQDLSLGQFHDAIKNIGDERQY